MRRYTRNITAALGLAIAMGAAGQAATSNFGTDVAAAIDASLAYFRTQNYFTTGGNVNATLPSGPITSATNWAESVSLRPLKTSY